MDQDLYELLASADPETLQRIVDAGLVDDRSKMAGERLGLGHEMMGTPQPEGRQVGHTYVASSPLEHAAAAVRNVLGARLAGQGMREQSDLAGQRGAGRLAYLRMLAGQGQQPTQPRTDPTAPAYPGFGMDYSQT